MWFETSATWEVTFYFAIFNPPPKKNQTNKKNKQKNIYTNALIPCSQLTCIINKIYDFQRNYVLKLH